MYEPEWTEREGAPEWLPHGLLTTKQAATAGARWYEAVAQDGAYLAAQVVGDGGMGGAYGVALFAVAPARTVEGGGFVTECARPQRFPTIEEAKGALSFVALHGALFQAPMLIAGEALPDGDRRGGASLVFLQVGADPGTSAAHRMNLTLAARGEHVQEH